MVVALGLWCLLAVGAQSFRRDAVERVPLPPWRRGALSQPRPFGSRPLPLRTAVEKVPTLRERSQESFPLRESVEKRVSPNPVGAWWRKVPMIKQSDNHGKRIFCYYESWSSYRRPPATFTSDDIDPFSCSHIIYAFAQVDRVSYSIVPQDADYDIVKGGYRAIVGLKRKNSNLKVLLSVTGKLTKMASSASNRQKFIRSVGRVLAEHGFDGLDIHWEYPGNEEFGGKKEDKENLALLVEELSPVLEHRGWILTASVNPSRFVLKDGYDVGRLAPHLHHILLKTYDFNQDPEQGFALHPAPLEVSDVDSEPISIFLNVEYAVKYWLSHGARRSQLILGIPFFGRSYTLADPEDWKPGAPVVSMGYEGRYTQQPGFLAYYELCGRLKSKKWSKHRDPGGSPFMVHGDQWVGYEDPKSIKKKVDYLRKQSLGGAMIWALDLDDFSGVCGPKYPLLSALRSALSLSSLEVVGTGVGITSVTSENCTGEGYSANSRTCSVYHRCNLPVGMTYICPQGLYFDPTRNICNWPVYVPCPFDKPRPRESYNYNEVIPRSGSEKKVVCYFTSWAMYRKGDGKFLPEHMEPSLCTHIIYAFASLEPNYLTITPFDPWADIDNDLYKRITKLQSKGPKVLLALGGWTDSTGDKYSKLVGSPTARKTFVATTIAFLKRHGFSGVSLEWNYPVCWHSDCKRGKRADKNNYLTLTQELSRALKTESPPMELAVSISGYREIIDAGFEVEGLSREVDFMTVMTYDYHGAWEGVTGHVSPLYGSPDDKTPYYNTDDAIQLLIKKGAEREKLIVGVPIYGQTFTLNSKSATGMGSETKGVGITGPHTQQPGMMAYYEICAKVKKGELKKESSTDGPYAYGGDQWMSFDDPSSIATKGAYVKKEGLGGLMAWTIDLDDFLNSCCEDVFPMLRALNQALGRQVEPAAAGCKKPPTPITPPPPVTTLAPEAGLPDGGGWTEGTSTSTVSSTWWPTTATSTTTRRPASSKPTTTSTTTTTRRTTTTSRRTTTSRAPPTTQSTTEAFPDAVLVIDGEDNALPPTCSTGDYLEDSSNCNSFYRCILGEFRKQKCAGGLHWNNKKKICDWPSEAKCTSSGEETQLGTTKRPTPTRPTTSKRPEWTRPSTSRPTWTTSTMPPTIRPPKPTKPPKGVSCTNGQYYPNPDSCSAFYMCVNGVLMEQKCAAGLHWNPDSGICDWSFSVNCANYYQRYVPQNILRETGCSKGTFAPYPGSCNKYLLCQWDKYETQACAPGLHWNQELKICDWPDSAGCKKSVVPERPIPDDEFPVSSEETTTTPKPMTSKKPKPTTTKPTTTTQWTWKPDQEWSWTSTTTEEPWPETPYKHPLSGYYKVVCYFTNWAWYRQGKGKYLPEDIDSDLCTHIVYGFAVLDGEKLTIKAHDSWADFDNHFYRRVVWFKRKGVKVSLAIGGWNDSQGDKYSRLVNNPAARSRFIEHVVPMLQKYKFDGLDLDWEYPKCWQTDCSKGKDSDKEAFGLFVRELRQEFDKHGLLLSAAVSPNKKIVDAGYDLKAMTDGLDWIAVMCYDYHGQWDKKTGHLAPMYAHPQDDFQYFNANSTIYHWIEGGVPRRKLVVGMPLYGQGFTLANPKENGLNAPAPRASTAGPFTRAAGFLAYYEICDFIHNKGWKVVKDEKGRMGPYAYKGDQWVGFDDVEMIKYKSNWIRSMGLGGGMVWALDLDDFTNSCGEGRHPLLSTIAKTLADAPKGEEVPLPAPSPPVQRPKPTKPTTKRPVPTSKPPRATSKPTTEKTTTALITSEEDEFQKPETPMPDSDFKVVCYFTNWAWYRQGTAKFLPSDIDPSLCTHIVYGFAVLDGTNLVIKPHDSWADIDNKFYEKVTSLRKKGVKVTMAIGGWNDSAGDKYSRLVNNPGSRRRFIEHVVKFILDNDFDGLDLDWEYPKCWQVDCKKGPDSDKQAFADFVSELREAFNPHGLLLSAAVSPSKTVLDNGYDVPTLSAKLDWIAVMCYDYHGQWDKKTGHVAPMYAHEEDFDVTFNANFSMFYWMKQGADPKKLIMGMPMYGQSFSLAETTNNGLNAPTYGGGEAGDGTRARGFLSYYEICERVQKKGWKVVKDDTGAMGPYALLRDQWVGFDDAAMIKHKSEFVKAYGFGGAMIWALDLDDFRNNCGCEEYPLLRTINRVLRGYPKGPLCSISGKSTTSMSDPVTEPPPGTDDLRESGEDIVPCPNYAGSVEDCNKFYMCQFGKLVPQNCPPGLHFNKKKLLCDWPENADCNASDEISNEVIPEMPDEVPEVGVSGEETTTVDNLSEVVESISNEVPSDSGYKVVCYFTNWAWYRQGSGKYLPEDIDHTLCTHIVYAFAVLDSEKLVIKSHDSWADIDNEFYTKVSSLVKKGIKVLLGLGGWNDSAGSKYSLLVNNPSARMRFVKQAIQFIEKYKFQGLDLDWEYPKCWQVDCNKGPDSDKEAFASLVRELRAAFKPRGWLLSAAVSPSKAVIDQGYDVPVLGQHLDWISLMAYDYHGHWDGKTGHLAPLYFNPGDTYSYFNTNFSVNYWIEKGLARDKLVLGMPMYGQSFTLRDPEDHSLGAPISGPGTAGQFTRAAGFLAFYEICESVSSENWKVERNAEGNMGPIAYKGNQWVSYDDVEDIRKKAKLIKELGLGGGMIWALDLDDFRNLCHCGKYPLLSTINQELTGRKGNTNNCT